MARERGRTSTNAHRAVESWKILTETAKNRETIDSGDLSGRLGRPVPLGIGVILDHVGYFCRRQGYPPLTVLAVNGETEEPGEGWKRAHPGRNHQVARVRVWDHDWSSIPVPTPEELADAYRRHRPR